MDPLNRLRRGAVAATWGVGLVLALASWHRDAVLAATALVGLAVAGSAVLDRRGRPRPSAEPDDHAREAVLNHPMK
ncbi:hypothetical protein [Saccharopolyspora griseoalba]|uniref:Uncharacterized protein n=1 Tax=Saccharopolyspora griseoalba TaxID=1431848 RepID=A0ABW2LJ94_9PSEU